MKKTIYSLGIAVACVLSANAENADKSIQKAFIPSTDIEAVGLSTQPVKFNRVSPAPEKTRAGATKAEDFVGTYEWAGENLLNGVVEPNKGIMNISISPEDPNKLLVAGLVAYADAPLEANFDAATGRLYIPNQFTWFNSYYNYEVWFWNYSVQNGINEETGKPGYSIIKNDKTQFFFILEADGSLSAGEGYDETKWKNHTYTDAELLEVACFAADMMPQNQSGYFLMCAWIEAKLLQPFQFVEDEWAQLGMATFKDAWFPIFWEDGNTPAWEVPLYYNKTETSQRGMYMLYDPYGYGGEDNPYVLYNLNIAPNKPGYIIFDLSDPDCVPFKPLVFSITIDMGDPDEDEIPTPFWCYNWEGYNYFLQGTPKEDIIVYADQNDLDLSNFNKRTNLVTIYNPLFDIDNDFGGGYWWQTYTGVGQIELPENWADGVDSVLGENQEGPAQYFNLQGVRVVNPEKGQLVIVRKGNKVMKQVVR